MNNDMNQNFRRPASNYYGNGAMRRNGCGNPKGQMPQGNRMRCECGCDMTPQVPVNCGDEDKNRRRADYSCKETERDYENNCETQKRCPKVNSASGAFEEFYPVGMAYVPMQSFRMLMDEEEAFQKGTIFSELDYPFLMTKCARRCDCK